MSKGQGAKHGPIEVVWEAPPEPEPRQLAAYADAIEAVKQNPGAWARLRVFATGNAYTIRKQLASKYRENRWEFKVVRSAGPPETWALYARYRSPEQMRNGGEQ
jgi:hypothetical protein